MGIMEWLGFGKKKEEPKPAPFDPKAELQASLDRHTGNLKKAHAAVEQAASVTRNIDREYDVLVSDLAVLEKRMDQNPGDADLVRKVQRKKSQVEAKEAEMKEALDRYEQGKNQFEEFQADIEKTKREAAGLNIDLSLAEADEASAAFRAELKGLGTGQVATATSALRQQIMEKKARASVDRRLTEEPDNSEYLK
jgi:chromosome segregation ATPase